MIIAMTINIRTLDDYSGRLKLRYLPLFAILHIYGALGAGAQYHSLVVPADFLRNPSIGRGAAPSVWLMAQPAPYGIADLTEAATGVLVDVADRFPVGVQLQGVAGSLWTQMVLCGAVMRELTDEFSAGLRVTIEWQKALNFGSSVHYSTGISAAIKLDSISCVMMSVDPVVSVGNTALLHTVRAGFSHAPFNDGLVSADIVAYPASPPRLVFSVAYALAPMNTRLAIHTAPANISFTGRLRVDEGQLLYWDCGFTHVTGFTTGLGWICEL